MRFNTEMTEAHWSASDRQWHLTIDGGQPIVARYVVTALGLLSKTNFPDIPGLETFQGDMHHTAKWPKEYDVTGKKVGVIGCGSTGVQVITDIGGKVAQMDCYQRHPQYSVPSGDKKVTADEREWLNNNWDQIWHLVRNSITGFGFEESDRSYHDATPEERERIFQEVWDQGCGFRFMFATFNDITTDMDANKGAQDFIRRQIDKIVKDPEKAKKLKPHDVYARRPLCDGNASNGQKYFDQFNRDNVDVVDLKETPITQIEPKGIRTSDGKFHEHDLLIFATGFDAVEGNYTRLAIHGRDNLSLKDYWDELGPTSYLGSFCPNFPNFFLISGRWLTGNKCVSSANSPAGPKGPFTNMPPSIEVQVEFITDAIRDAEKSGVRVVEATHEAEREYSDLCDQLAANSLFWKAEVSLC
jgi:cyclohexanone monooxygenase